MLAIKRQDEALESGENVERIFLNCHRNAWALAIHNLAWIFVIANFHNASSPFEAFKWAFYCYLWTYALGNSRVEFNPRFVRLIISLQKFQLDWDEIQSAETNLKQSRLVLFASHDNRIAIPKLNKNLALRARLMAELEARDIPLSTTKRAEYYITKNREASHAHR